MGLLKFEQPPINEVIFGCDLECQNFQTIHQGLYWNEIKSDYPNSSTQPLIYKPNPQQQFIMAPYSRVWYESSDKQKLIQLQHDRYLFNWRRLSSAQKYPSFEVLFPNFKQQFEKFNSWAEKCEVPVGQKVIGLELTYLNHFDKNNGWRSPLDTHDLINSFGYGTLLTKFTPKFESIFSQFVSKKTDAEIALAIRQGIKGIGNEVILILEITVRQKNVNISIDQWFKFANEDINLIFDSITTNKGKEQWGIK